MDRKYQKAMIPIAKILRKNMTNEERLLWYRFLRTYPVKFLRQKPLGNYIVDFYCAAAKLVVELDGSQHNEAEKAEKDAERTDYLEAYGLRVVRIANIEVTQHFESVCEYIDQLVREAIGE